MLQTHLKLKWLSGVFTLYGDNKLELFNVSMVIFLVSMIFFFSLIGILQVMKTENKLQCTDYNKKYFLKNKNL